MGINSKHEYLQAILERYHQATKKQKHKILDEFCAVCEYNRKYAIQLLNGRRTRLHQLQKQHRGRPKKYTDPILLTVLRRIWITLNLPCSKRLKAALPLWLPFYALQYRTTLSPKHHDLLLSISPATIDRLMAPIRNSARKQGLCTTKPGSLLKQHVPISTDQWDVTQPGFLEADTVAHCGTSTEGMFVFTVNCVDLATGWREQRAVWGKGERGVLLALQDIERSLPFPLLGFDCDNGSEFLNWSILKYFTNRKRPVQYTRSRPYHKNDNAHIEEKNWTLVRQYIGYQRLAQPCLADQLNELYRSEWRFLMNFFIPSTKLIRKERLGSKIIKVYDRPQTPLQRLSKTSVLSRKTKKNLQNTYSSLNPFLLQQQVSKKIKALLAQADPLPRYVAKDLLSS
jgi:hypothetical protein